MNLIDERDLSENGRSALWQSASSAFGGSVWLLFNTIKAVYRLHGLLESINASAASASLLDGRKVIHI
jgi:hypothetical protein